MKTQCEVNSKLTFTQWMLEDPTNFVYTHINGVNVDWAEVAKNDGLSFEDFCEWFKVRQSEPMAVIHFTKFKYSNLQQ